MRIVKEATTRAAVQPGERYASILRIEYETSTGASYSNLIFKRSLGCRCSFCGGGFLFNSYQKIIQNAFWVALATPVMVSYSILTPD